MSRNRRGEGGRGVPTRRDRMPAKEGPFPRRHYGVRRSRDASRGSAVAETPAGGTQLSGGRPAGKRDAETRPGTHHAETPSRSALGGGGGNAARNAPAQLPPWQVQDVMWRCTRFHRGRARHHSRNTTRGGVRFLLGTRETPSTRRRSGGVRHRHGARNTAREYKIIVFFERM